MPYSQEIPMTKITTLSLSVSKDAAHCFVHRGLKCKAYWKLTEASRKRVARMLEGKDG